MQGVFFGSQKTVLFLKENLNASRPFLSIPQSGGGEHVITFRWDHRLLIIRQNLFVAFKRVPR